MRRLTRFAASNTRNVKSIILLTWPAQSEFYRRVRRARAIKSRRNTRCWKRQFRALPRNELPNRKPLYYEQSCKFAFQLKMIESFQHFRERCFKARLNEAHWGFCSTIIRYSIEIDLHSFAFVFSSSDGLYRGWSESFGRDRNGNYWVIHGFLPQVFTLVH